MMATRSRPWNRTILMLGLLTLSLLAGCTIPGLGGQAAFSVAPAHKDVAYADASSTQKLDLYLPAGAGPFPVIVNIHGGGFKLGDKGMVDDASGKAFLAAGYAIASIDYRLSGEAKFPAAVLDAKAAVRFLRANAAKYNLNPDKVVAFGQSAGGNIASMLGTTGNVAEFDDPSLGNAGVSSRVQAVINWFGPNDFAQMDAQAKASPDYAPALHALDQSAAEIRHAIATDPQARFLLEQLRRTYARRLALTQRAVMT